jgi:hypothetical protein
VNKIHEIVQIKEEKMGHEKIMCFFLKTQIGFTLGTNALGPWLMGFPMV